MLQTVIRFYLLWLSINSPEPESPAALRLQDFQIAFRIEIYCNIYHLAVSLYHCLFGKFCNQFVEHPERSCYI